jgi:hypothetical protein
MLHLQKKTFKFAICGIAQQKRLQNGDTHLKEIEDLGLRNNPKNVQICDLRTNKKIS